MSEQLRPLHAHLGYLLGPRLQLSPLLLLGRLSKAA